MRIGVCWLYAISKYGYPPSLENTFRVIKEMHDLGFRYIELEGVGEENMKEIYANRKELKKLCDDLGLIVHNFCPVIPDIVSLEQKQRQKGRDLFKMGIELANFFGCETIQTDSFAPPLKFIGEKPYKEMVDFGLQFKVEISPGFSWEAQWGVLVESFKFCAEEAKKAGLKFCLEPRVGEMICTTDGILRLIDWVDDENLGAVLDTGHLNAQKEILPLSVEKLGKRVFYVHFSDNDGKVNEHLGLGRGNIDFEEILKGLLRHNFQGVIGLDIGRIPNLDEEMKRSKEFLIELFEKLGIKGE
ncbi:sugar phosphate isomerase/epimerase [bacterium]|nr:sugar phosphate isomerase/epimerase [bacterium]